MTSPCLDLERAQAETRLDPSARGHASFPLN